MTSHEQPPFVLHSEMAQRFVGYLLGRLGLFAASQFDARMESVGLDRRQWGVLNALDNEQGFMTQQQLGRSIAIHPSTMVATIDELETEGLVERGPHPSDRRAHAVSLTDHGYATLDRARRLAGEAQGELMAPLTAAEQATLHQLLLKLAEGIAERPD